MREPDRRNPGEAPERASLSPEERRRMMRASLLRPVNIVVPVIGVGIFATTLLWWVPPLTALTYAALVFLAVRDATFQERVLRGRNATQRSLNVPGSEDPDVPPERRAHWLPRGETRQKVEAALTVYRKAVTAIEESDDVTRAVLDDAIPKLHAVAERMVDVAHHRERAAEAVENLRSRATQSNPQRDRDLGRLEQELRAADAEISGMVDGLLNLRARVVRISIENESAARAAAGDLNRDLDEMNLRLEALGTTLSAPDEP
jgi:hypothetical protein